MAGLPRKYAQMGFKRGWAAYKRYRKQGKSVPQSVYMTRLNARRFRSSRTTSKVVNVARRRRSKSRRFSGFARKAARRGGVGNSAALFQVDAMAYGAVRQYASDAIAPFTSKIPLGGLSDEIGMGLLCWGVSKYAGGGMLGSIARKGLVIENARVGEALVQGGLGQLTGTTGGSQSNAQNGWI